MIDRPGLRRHQTKSQLYLVGHMKVYRPKLTYHRRCVATIVQSTDRVMINHTRKATNSFGERARRVAKFLKINQCKATRN